METPQENDMNEAVHAAPDLEAAEAPVPEEAEELEALAPTEPSTEADEADVAADAADAAEAERTEVEDAGAEPEAILAPEPVVEPVEPEPVAEPEPSTDEAAAEPAAEPEEGGAVEVEPALAAEIEEALEGVEGAEEELEEWVPGEWFVVHTYAGYENKVKVDLETRVSSMNMEDKIYEIVIPMEDVVEIKGGKKQTVQRKVFPGYLLVRMDMDDDSWYVVRNTPGVTGFVGSGTKPIPLSEKEVDNILGRGKGEEAGEKPKPRAEWQPGDPVRVTTGPFANFQGVINEVDAERQKVKVLVNIFGRETPVELAFDQISKV